MIFQTVEWNEKWRSSSVFLSNCTAFILGCIKYYCSSSPWKGNADCKAMVTKSVAVSPATEHVLVLCYSWRGEKPTIPQEKPQTPWFLFKQWNYRKEVTVSCNMNSVQGGTTWNGTSLWQPARLQSQGDGNRDRYLVSQHISERKDTENKFFLKSEEILLLEDFPPHW